MGSKSKKFLSFILRFAFSVGLLWFLFSRMHQKGDLITLIELLNAVDIKYILYALILFVIINGFLLIRLRIFIHAFELNVPWLNMIRYSLIGLFGNLFMPSAIGGDVIKVVGMCNNAREKPKIVAAVLLDRLTGFTGIVVVSVFALLAGFQYLNNPALWVAVVMMASVLILLGCVLFNERLYRFFCHTFHFFPKLKKAVMQMHYDIVLLKDKKEVLIKAVAISSFNQIILAAVFFLVAKGLHQTIAAFYFIIFTPLTCIASSFPSIGGLGFREGMLEYLLLGLGVTAGIGVSIGLLNFFFMVIVGIFGWAFFMLTKDSKAAS